MIRAGLQRSSSTAYSSKQSHAGEKGVFTSLAFLACQCKNGIKKISLKLLFNHRLLPDAALAQVSTLAIAANALYIGIRTDQQPVCTEVDSVCASERWW